MLAWLEEQLNEPMEIGKTKGAWIETDPDGKSGCSSRVTEEELRSARLMHDSHSGTLRVHLDSRNVTIEFEVQKVAKLPPGSDAPNPERNGIVPGDGTVPVWSAEAPARGAEGAAAPGVQMVFDQGGYVHQESYNHPWARWALLYSIVQLAQDAVEPKC